MPYKKTKTISHTRRLFLKKTASSVLLLTSPLEKLFALNKQAKEITWRELIDYARWCPTVHNLQPHKIKIISATEALLYYDPSRLLPVEDPGCVFVTVAMGVFIEHLSIAASVSDKTITIADVFEPINIHQTQPTLFVKLQITDAVKKESLNRELIKKRRTSRLHYNGNPLSAATIERLKTQASLYGHELFSSSDETLISYIIKLNQETLFEDISTDDTRKELNRLFRYSETEAKERKDGLWSRCMCVPGKLMQSVFRHPGLWTGFRRKILSGYYKNGFTGTTTICWFGGSFNNTYDWLAAGSMLARCWLITTDENAYIHPFGSLITNANAYRKINETFTLPSGDKKIWMVFRAGYSHEPTRSFRLDTDEILLS